MEESDGSLTSRTVALADVTPPAGMETVRPAPTGRLITCFSPKGGVGCTMLAVNLAIALCRPGRQTVLLDGGLSAGNVDLFLGLGSSNAILKLVHGADRIDRLSVQRALVRHVSGLYALLAPRQPEQAETITPEHLSAILAALRPVCDTVIADTSTGYDERVLLLLDNADDIVVPVAPDLASLRSVASFLRMSKLLGHPQERLLLVLVRADSVPPREVTKMEAFLGRRFDHSIPSDGRTATAALNSGVPVVLRSPHTALARSLLDLGGRLAAGHRAPAPASAR